MKVMAQLQNQKASISVYVCASIISLFLTVWFSFGNEVINRDAICYLQSAQTFGQEGLHAAMQLCNQAKWPFYSILIYAVSSLSTFSLQTSANLLDGLFSLITVIAFIYLVRLLSGSRRLMWYALVVILCAHEFNMVREFIIRDHGFWAFYLMSIIMLIQYFRSHQFSYALFWWGSLVLATLFRIEGAIFLLALPFLAFLDSGNKGKSFLQLSGFTIITGLLLAVFFLHSHFDLARLMELKAQALQGSELISYRFLSSKAVLAHQLLSPYAAKDAGWILLMLFGVWYLQNVIATLSLVYAGLLLFAWRKKIIRFDLSANRVLMAYLLINVVITLSFLAENLFLSKRYLMGLTLVLMLWVPFALQNLLEQSEIKRWMKVGVTAVILIYASFGFTHDHSSKLYLRDAGQWIAANTPATSRIFCNDKQVMYYSHHYGNEIFAEEQKDADLTALSGAKWKQYDYLALRLSKETTNNALIKEMGLTPVKQFADRHGDQVVIYQVR